MNDRSNLLKGTAVDLNTFLSPASFWWPQRVDSSAWLEHAPFAFWLVNTLQPRVIVELGTHSGYSYFSFCQAVKSLAIDTRCFAVDHWHGDEHAGTYGENVFLNVEQHNNDHYSGFSQLIRATFDEALAHFPDGSIDLLHIDGRHRYDDVKHDFESWRMKLSDRAIVLFHDTKVLERGFGVFKFWEEVATGKPTFEFHHGHGLGVLGCGINLPSELVHLFALTDREVETAKEVRQAYSRLGAAIQMDVEAKIQLSELAVTLHKSQESFAATNDALAQATAALEAERLAAAELRQQIASLTAGIRTLSTENDRLLQATSTLSRTCEEERHQFAESLSERFSELAALTSLLRNCESEFEWLKAVVATLVGDSRVGRFIGLLPGPVEEMLRAKQLQKRQLFNSAAYMQAHPDVRRRGKNALRHYLVHGLKEGRARE